MLVDVIIFGKVNIEEDDLDKLKTQAPIDAAEILFRKGERLGLKVEPTKLNKVPTEAIEAITGKNVEPIFGMGEVQETPSKKNKKGG